MEVNLESRGPLYGLTVINNSSQIGSACLYQANHRSLYQASGEGGWSAYSLAWFARGLYPNTRLRFDWRVDYCFVWGETGQLRPGVNFFAGQTPPAELSTMNLITLDYDGAFHFKDQMDGPQMGLFIRASHNIPLDQGAVGIGMSGQGTMVIQAQPNMTYTFTPRPQYRIAFGNFRQGDVLDVEDIDNSAQIEFPPGIYQMAATLNPDNTWTISRVV
jgi:rhizosphere induced protein